MNPAESAVRGTYPVSPIGCKHCKRAALYAFESAAESHECCFSHLKEHQGDAAGRRWVDWFMRELEERAAKSPDRVVVEDAHLEHVEFHDRVFPDNLVFKNAELDNASFVNCVLRKCEVQAFVQQHAEEDRVLPLTGTVFEGTDLVGAKFHVCGIVRVRFASCNLVGAVFGDTEAEDCRIDGCDFSGSTFGNLQLRGVSLNKVKLRDAATIESLVVSGRSEWTNVDFGEMQLAPRCFDVKDALTVHGDCTIPEAFRNRIEGDLSSKIHGVFTYSTYPLEQLKAIHDSLNSLTSTGVVHSAFGLLGSATAAAVLGMFSTAAADSFGVDWNSGRVGVLVFVVFALLFACCDRNVQDSQPA